MVFAGFGVEGWEEGGGVFVGGRGVVAGFGVGWGMVVVVGGVGEEELCVLVLDWEGGEGEFVAHFF